MRRKYLLRTLAAFAIVGTVYVTWRSWHRQSQTTYRTLEVDRGNIVAVVTATGTVNPVTTVQVGTYVSGRIIAIDVDFNSPVRRNQRVAKIDPAPFEVKVQKAEAALANARAKLQKDRADLKLKELTWKRYRELAARELIAPADLDQARTEYEQARAQLALDEAAIRQAEADLAEAKVNLKYTDILAPVDGIVVARNVNVGQTVAASFQTPTLFLIADDLTKMQVDTAVSESDIGQIREGQKASFTVDAYSGRRFTGVVTQVRNSPTTVQNVVTYDVVVAVDNSDLALKPGMTATVTIVVDERHDVLRVPVRALRFDPHIAHAGEPAVTRPQSERSRVWVLRGEHLAPVDITLGLRNDTHAELLEGELQPGDRVVVALDTNTDRGRTAKVPLSGPLRFR